MLRINFIIFIKRIVFYKIYIFSSNKTQIIVWMGNTTSQRLSAKNPYKIGSGGVKNKNKNTNRNIIEQENELEYECELKTE